MATRTRTIPGPSHVLLNRLIFVSSLLGAVVAGYLWWLHAANLDIPCGGSGGCDAVAASPYARLWGIPVAAYGTALYLFLAVLAFVRSLPGTLKRDQRLLKSVIVLSALGTLVSFYLTYVELFVIHAVCRWCIASQTLILAVFLAARAAWVLKARSIENRT